MPKNIWSGRDTTVTKTDLCRILTVATAALLTMSFLTCVSYTGEASGQTLNTGPQRPWETGLDEFLPGSSNNQPIPPALPGTQPPTGVPTPAQPPSVPTPGTPSNQLVAPAPSNFTEAQLPTLPSPPYVGVDIGNILLTGVGAASPVADLLYPGAGQGINAITPAIRCAQEEGVANTRAYIDTWSLRNSGAVLIVSADQLLDPGVVLGCLFPVVGGGPGEARGGGGAGGFQPCGGGYAYESDAGGVLGTFYAFYFGLQPQVCNDMLGQLSAQPPQKFNLRPVF